MDIGVHQDGLVHISSLSDKFVEDPHQVVKTGDIVKVKVLEVDVPRKRIALTMRLDESAVKNDGKSDRTLSTKARRMRLAKSVILEEIVRWAMPLPMR